MKILQYDVNKIEWELIEPETDPYERDAPKKKEVEDALAMFIAVENDDTEAFASKAISDVIEFAAKLKRKNLVLYPFAHLSSNLEAPARAMTLFHYMIKEAENKSKLSVSHAPFGWNKALRLDVKGHPLAEMSRSYGSEVKGGKKVKKRVYDVSLAKKADWSGLPENDHRSIAERQDLFSFQEVSPAMVYWHPNGFIIYDQLMKYIRDKLDEYGYQMVATPIMANTALWHISGHIDHYRENMFVFDANDQEVGLKPMNCPFAMLLFKSRKWSYRDLPLRLADFDKLYRNEISGALSGLFRVRELTQDDAHIYMREDQIESEINSMIKFVNEMYGIFSLDFKAKLSTMPDSHLGDEDTWKKATDALEGALKRNKVKYEIKDKEGAFYGPKIDIDVKDSMGREWQCATIQLDYQLPQRFGLTYTGEDGKEHMPIVLHRVVYGSLERFLAVLIEHLNGKFPAWLAPVQVRVLSISEKSSKYAEEIYKKLREQHIRVELDISDKTLQYKIRDGQIQQIPYMIILGDKEVEGKKISVRSRSGKQRMGISIDEFLPQLKEEISNRKKELML
ncbi:MAG: threonine--tRNA ligase [Candidatus Marsarchaeota archaeon]|nr:threonine--tRNA ligase [Candidatus Marsarchaeota archaeon]